MRCCQGLFHLSRTGEVESRGSATGGGTALSGGACSAFCPAAGPLTPAPLPFGRGFTALLAVAARAARHLAPLGLASRPVGTLDIAGRGHVAPRGVALRRAQKTLAAALAALRPAGPVGEGGGFDRRRADRQRQGGGRERGAGGKGCRRKG